MKIRGAIVSTTMPRPDWDQTDPKKADYIKNKPDFTPASHASDKNNPHGVTAAQVGAAPAKYGLGEDSPRTTAWNSQTRSGFYKSSSNSPDGALWYGVTCTSSTARMAQIAFSPEFDNGLIEARRYKNGSSDIGEWEYVNPPMLEGVEYRTTERFNGKPVYTKLINGGSVANNKTISFKDEDGFGYGSVIRFCGCIIRTEEDGTSSYEYPLPSIQSISNDDYNAWLFVDNVLHEITFKCGEYIASNYQTCTIVAQVWYIK